MYGSAEPVNCGRANPKVISCAPSQCANEKAFFKKRPFSRGHCVVCAILQRSPDRLILQTCCLISQDWILLWLVIKPMVKLSWWTILCILHLTALRPIYMAWYFSSARWKISETKNFLGRIWVFFSTWVWFYVENQEKLILGLKPSRDSSFMICDNPCLVSLAEKWWQEYEKILHHAPKLHTGIKV